MNYRRIDVQPISGALGAEIYGIDIACQTSDDEIMQEVRMALSEQGVIFFRDQEITPEQHIAFGRWFGPLNRHPVLAPGARSSQAVARSALVESIWFSAIQGSRPTKPRMLLV